MRWPMPSIPAQFLRIDMDQLAGIVAFVAQTGGRGRSRRSTTPTVKTGQPRRRAIAGIASRSRRSASISACVAPLRSLGSHAAIDRQRGFIRGWNATSASAYDGEAQCEQPPRCQMRHPASLLHQSMSHQRCQSYRERCRPRNAGRTKRPIGTMHR